MVAIRAPPPNRCDRKRSVGHAALPVHRHRQVSSAHHTSDVREVCRLGPGSLFEDNYLSEQTTGRELTEPWPVNDLAAICYRKLELGFMGRKPMTCKFSMPDHLWDATYCMSSHGQCDRNSLHFHLMSATAAMNPGKVIARAPRGSFVHVANLPGTDAAKSSAVSRAHRAGELLPVRKGLYYKGVKTRYGMTRPSSEEIASEVLGKTGVGPSGYTAARALGLTTQLPSQPSFTVAGPVPSSLTGFRVSRRNNMRRRKLRYTEIALLELLRGDWETTVDGGWSALVSAYRSAVQSRSIRPEAITQAMPGERSPAARRNFEQLSGAAAA